MLKVSQVAVAQKAVWSTVNTSKAMNQANYLKVQATCLQMLTNETPTLRMQSTLSTRLALQESATIRIKCV